MMTVFIKKHGLLWMVGGYLNGKIVHAKTIKCEKFAENYRQELLKLSDKEINEHFARPRKTVRPFSGSRYME